MSITLAVPEPEIGEATAIEARAVKAMIEENIVVCCVVWSFCLIWFVASEFGDSVDDESCAPYISYSFQTGLSIPQLTRAHPTSKIISRSS